MTDADADADADALVVYADYVCPFCYLGRASLAKYRESRERPLDVEWHPYDLRGYKRGPGGSVDHDVDDGKDDDYFAQVRENVERLAEEYGVEMRLDASLDVDSWNAQQVALAVRREESPETFEAFHASVFDALWQESLDVGDPDLLADLAGDAGVASVDVREAVGNEALTADLRAAFADARDRGVTGVPTFTFDGRAARGAVPPAQLRRLVEGA